MVFWVFGGAGCRGASDISVSGFRGARSFVSTPKSITNLGFALALYAVCGGDDGMRSNGEIRLLRVRSWTRCAAVSDRSSDMTGYVSTSDISEWKDVATCPEAVSFISMSSTSASVLIGDGGRAS